LDCLQLVSFGCGLDAVTTDQVKEILEKKNKIYTSLKIDEISNLGAAKIRIRSLIAVINQRMIREERQKSGSLPLPPPRAKNEETKPAIFSLENKKDYTLLVPQFSPFHMGLIAQAIRFEGYKVCILDTLTKDTIDEGLKYVHNDACFPAVCVIGQLMQAVNSKKFDVNKIALLLSQTGGCCRATNYPAFLTKALQDNGTPQIPVLSFNLYALSDPHPGFTIGVGMVTRMLMGCVIGDVFSVVVPRVRPYEKVKGSTNELHKRLEAVAKEAITYCDRQKIPKRHSTNYPRI